MPEDLFEETDLLMKVTITKGKPKSGQVTFILKRDGTEEKKDQALEGDVAQWTYTLPKVDDTKDNYPVQWRVECDSQPFGGVHDCVVWPKNANLTAVNGTQAALVGFRFRIMQNGNSVGAFITEDNGVSPPFPLRKPAAFTIEALPPYQITNTVTAVGRNRKVEAVLSFEAEFLAPTGTYEQSRIATLFGDNNELPPDGTLHQFVNLASDSDGQDSKGNLLTIKIGAKGDRTKAPSDRIGKAGVYAFVSVKFGPATKSKRTTPATQLIDGLELRERKEVTAGKEYSGKVELSGPEGTGRFKLNLGMAGGDECEVKIGGTDQCGDATIKFINWRLLHYELLYPKVMKDDLESAGKYMDLPATVNSKVAELLKPLFIRYELFKSKEFDATGLKGTVPSEFVGEDPSGRQWYVYAKAWENEVGMDKFDSKDKTCVKVRLWDKGFKEEENEESHAPVLKKKQTDHKLGKGYYLKFGAETGAALKPTVTGTNTGWSVKIDNKAPYLKEPTFVWETENQPSTSGAVRDRIRIEELNLLPPATSVHVEFRENDADIRDPRPIRNFIIDLLKRVPHLRAQGNSIRIKLTGEWGGPVAEARFKAVKTEIDTAFRSNVKPVPVHPGLDDNGNPLKGTIDPSWIVHKTFKSVQITLPVRNSISDPILPGDIVGDTVSDTNAPIVFKFKMKNCGGVNGNAGDGKQNMVLRDEDGLSMTIAHELGHAMGMTITDRMTSPTWMKKKPPGMPDAKHVDESGTYYVSTTGSDLTGGRRKKHKGSHCAFGLAADVISKTDWGDSTGTCIMWGAGADTRTKYCDTCADFLRARSLKDIHSKWDARSDEDL
jgi:hypothetical protein